MACAGGCAWRYLGRIVDADAVTVAAVGCEQPYRIICVRCSDTRQCRCGKSSARACTPCSGRARARVERVGRSGQLVGIVGVFLTLTAPSWVEHYLPNGHACPCTGSAVAHLPASADLDEWNASAGKRWNRFMQALRRETGRELEYFKGTEVQRRGALHFHAMIRDRSGRPIRVGKQTVKRLAVAHGFGHAVDVQPLADGHARYVAKYVTKAAGDRPDVPWKGTARTERVNRATGELVKGTRPCYRATYRTWSASRQWGRTMASIRAAQSHHEACMDRLPDWGRLEPARWWVCSDVLGVPLRPPGG